MRTYFLLLFMLVSSAVLHAQTQAEKDFQKLDWLVGEWQLVSSTAGVTGLETWRKIAGNAMEGTGVTQKGTDVVSSEKIRLVIKNDELYYVADVPGNKGPVYFKITTITKDGFVSENPAHDFPKMIIYKNLGSKMTATISGNGKATNYNFIRKQ